MNKTVVISVHDRSGALTHAERLMRPGPLALQSVAVMPGAQAGTGRMTLVLESRASVPAAADTSLPTSTSWPAQADGAA
ncbi:MAG: hypothetical protein NVS9B3_06960 [Gemmatimonadaceae bacterium]